MKTSIIGYPRIGKTRQLKFWIEDFFSGELTQEALNVQAGTLRKDQLRFIHEAGIDFIPSSDFSFYDNVLDTAVMFNIVPERYRNLKLNALETYFAMARGYQGEHGDVKALPMKKWFNTNYHYIVPEFEDSTDVKFKGGKLIEEYEEARSIGIQTKPVIIGPLTLLKLSSCSGARSTVDFAENLFAGYCALFAELNAAGVNWLQIDEPCLVTDLSQQDIDLFISLYTRLLAHKGTLNVLLQTYFGDIRDIYKQVIALDFDGIGLDFAEGKKTLELIEKYTFPHEKLLFAGIINGKNIWRNNYKNSLSLINKLTACVGSDQLVLGTSCSLLHVPYSIKGESKLTEEKKAYFAFAEEKIAELSSLKNLADNSAHEKDKAFIENKALFDERPNTEDPTVRDKVSALTENDFERLPDLDTRARIQKTILNLPLFPTTTIGSFPQTPQVKADRAKFRRGEITKEQYETGIRNKLSECIALQEKIGLDVLVHGEYERNDMVEYFGENLSGFIFTENGWVQSYGTRCVKPPIIWGDLKRREPFTVKYIKYAQSLTDKPVKGMLTGPVTILNWSFPREDITLRETALQLALAIKEEVTDLEAAGIKIIQIDEAALKEKLPLRKAEWHKDYLDWAIAAFRLVHAGVKAETQIHTHMCYSEFGDIIMDIEAMDADVITFEASRSGLDIIKAIGKTDFRPQVGPGVYDIHSPRVPSENEIEQTVLKMLENGKIKKEKFWINPDCGLKTRGERETTFSLENLVSAARKLRKKLA